MNLRESWSPYRGTHQPPRASQRITYYFQLDGTVGVTFRRSWAYALASVGHHPKGVRVIRHLQENIYKTYYGLRLGMFTLAIMLFLSVAIELVTFHCMQSSISAYYYTPARPVFIADLCAIGACLIIYRGNKPTENALLNVAGFLAFMIAFVPTSYPNDPNDRGCVTTNVPSQTDISFANINNAMALFAAGLIAILLSKILLKPRYVSDRPLKTPATWSLIASATLLFAGTALFIFDYGFFAKRAHGAAAILFFVSTLAVIFINTETKIPPYRRLYRAVFWATFLPVALIIIAGILIGDNTFRTWTFWAETVGIAGFGAFWLVQTGELGGFVDRSEAIEAATKEPT